MDDLVRKINPAALRQNPHQLLFDFLRRFAFGQAEAVRYAEDVRVHNDAFCLIEGHAEDDVGCFAGRAGDGDEFGECLRNLRR